MHKKYLRQISKGLDYYKRHDREKYERLERELKAILKDMTDGIYGID